MTPIRRLLKSAAFALVTLGGLADAATAAPVAERVTPSHQPVPRYVSIKKVPANARAGPGDDYRVRWVYNVRGLPLQVIAETSDWRRVCDAEGQTAWLNQRLVALQRTVINTSDHPLPMLGKPSPEAKPKAFLSARAMANLDKCDRGWCKVKAGGVAGWVRQGALWGAADAVQCH